MADYSTVIVAGLGVLGVLGTGWINASINRRQRETESKERTADRENARLMHEAKQVHESASRLTSEKQAAYSELVRQIGFAPSHITEMQQQSDSGYYPTPLLRDLYAAHAQAMLLVDPQHVQNVHDAFEALSSGQFESSEDLLKLVSLLNADLTSR